MAVSPSASLAVTVAVPEPASLPRGLPDTWRVDVDIRTPRGRPLTEYLSVPSPPRAAGTVNAEIEVRRVQSWSATEAVPNEGTRSSFTVQSKDSVSVSPSLSVTVTVAVPMPAAPGVPETRLKLDMATPAGSPEAA